MIKKRISKEEYEALSDEDKGFYDASGDEFVFAVEGMRRMKEGKDREAQKHTETVAALNEEKRRNDELQAKLDEHEDGKLKSETERQIKSFERQIEKLTKEKDANAAEHKALLDTFAQKFKEEKIMSIANTISSQPAVAAHILRTLVDVDFEDGSINYTYKDAEGNVKAAWGADDLIKSIMENKDYAGIIKSDSKASGSTTPDVKDNEKTKVTDKIFNVPVEQIGKDFQSQAELRNQRKVDIGQRFLDLAADGDVAVG